MNSGSLESRIAALVGTHIKDGESGLALLIGEKGGIVYRGAFGAADMAKNARMRADHRFFIASVSKQFTTMALMMLKDRGLIEYDGSIRKYFPDFPPYADKVTIRNLMTHTSGIPEYFTDAFIVSAVGREEMSLEAILERIKGLGDAEFEAGTKFAYCNSAYVMLGAIVEKVSGTSFPEFVERNIFEPLGMSDSIVPSDAKRVIPRIATGYTLGIDGKGPLSPAPFCMAMVGWADGNVVTTVDDLFRWHNALYTEKLVRRDTFREAVTSFTLPDGSETGYGFGWFLNNRRGLAEHWHTGGTLGFTSHCSRFPDIDVAVLLLTNSEIRREELYGQIVEAYLGERMDPVPYARVSMDELARETGSYSDGKKKCEVTVDPSGKKLSIRGDLDRLSGDYSLSPLGRRRFRVDSAMDYYITFSGERTDGRMTLSCNGLPARLSRVG